HSPPPLHPPTPPQAMSSADTSDSALEARVAEQLKNVAQSPKEEQPTTSAAPSALAQQLRALAAGGFGGICAVVVGHPFDLVKVRLQTAERGVYSSAVDVVRKSIARDGLRRGVYARVSA